MSSKLDNGGVDAGVVVFDDGGEGEWGVGGEGGGRAKKGAVFQVGWECVLRRRWLGGERRRHGHSG